MNTRNHRDWDSTYKTWTNPGQMRSMDREKEMSSKSHFYPGSSLQLIAPRREKISCSQWGNTGFINYIWGQAPCSGVGSQCRVDSMASYDRERIWSWSSRKVERICKDLGKREGYDQNILYYSERIKTFKNRSLCFLFIWHRTQIFIFTTHSNSYTLCIRILRFDTYLHFGKYTWGSLDFIASDTVCTLNRAECSFLKCHLWVRPRSGPFHYDIFWCRLAVVRKFHFTLRG